jgi:hypothetical protein
VGEATRRKNLGIQAVPGPDQPVPADKLTALYPELLELELAKANARLEAQRLNAVEAALNAKVAVLGIDLKEWSVNLKTGKMTKVKP